MKIVHLSTEFAPIAKAGGLGEVLVGLVRECTHLGQKVEVILPKYGHIPTAGKEQIAQFSCQEKGTDHNNIVWKTKIEECQLLLLETDHPARYFDRPEIYGYPDDVPRFLYFAKACLEFLKKRQEPIDILHLHDWPLAIAAVLAKDLILLPVKSIIFTIHNAAYQGHSAPWDLDAIGINGLHYLHPDRLQDDTHPHTISLLKGGIVYADAVNTVSPSYAKEILTHEIGHDLSKTLRKHANKLFGILNGIDQVLWNPEKDPHIPENYSVNDSFARISSAKKAARKWIQNTFALQDHPGPWIGTVTRLVPQKSPELLEEAIHQTIHLGGAFLFLGSSPIPGLQMHFDELKRKYAHIPHVLLHFAYNEPLAHAIYAALDFLIVPSVYEPCGLTQLIAMRYGTIPIVRSTGGLKDTVFDINDPTTEKNAHCGIVFRHLTHEEVTKALQRAFHLFHKEPQKITELMQRGMRFDYSWAKPAKEYLELYARLLSRKGSS